MSTEETTREVEAIRRRMGQIRREIHADVNVAADHFRQTFQWQGYVRSNPWAALGVAAGAGLAVAWLLVPRPRVRVIRRGDDDHSRDDVRVEDAEERAERKGWMSMALGFLLPVAVRAAQNYAIKFIEGRLDDTALGGFLDQEDDHVQSDPAAPEPAE